MKDYKLEAIDLAQKFDLDFEIKKLPMFGKSTRKGLDAFNDIVDIETWNDSDYFGLLNDKSGEIINVVKTGYTPTQNVEVLENVLRGIEGFGELSVQKAGSINGGRKTYVQLAIEGESIVGNDVIQKYITIIDSNDGSTGLSVGIGDLTMSCQNQFFQFNKSGSKYRHTVSVTEKVDGLVMLIHESLMQSMKQIETYRKLQSTPASRDIIRRMVKELTGVDTRMNGSKLQEIHSTRQLNTMSELTAHITSEVSDKGMNLWGLHSGVTSWTTHSKAAPKRENGRLESSMLGTNYKTNQKSLQLVTTLI